MGAGASTAGNKKKNRKKDLRSERYEVSIEFLAPINNRLSSELEIYFQGALRGTPRIPLTLPGKKRHASISRNQIEALGKNRYRQSFQYRDHNDLGNVDIAWLKNRGSDFSSNITVSKITIKKTMSGGLKCPIETLKTFPCYCILTHGDQKHFFEGSAYLPTQTPYNLINWRTREIDENKDMYNMSMKIEDLPMTTTCLHDKELLPEHQTGIVDFKVQAAQVILELEGQDLVKDRGVWKEIGGTSQSSDCLIHELFSKHSGDSGSGKEIRKEFLVPSCASAFNKNFWKNDVHFGRQFLQGPHNELLVLCKDRGQIPDFLLNSGVFASAVSALQEGSSRWSKTITQEIVAGRIFVLDLRNLSSFVSIGHSEIEEKYIATAPMCLFYLADNPNQKFGSAPMVLLPAVITLDGEDDDAPIFSCLDSPWLWQLAKAHVSVADVQVQFAISYLLNTVIAIEPFAVSLFRNLSSLHPVRKVLYPYLRYKCSESIATREGFMGEQGILNGLFPLGEEGILDLIKDGVSAWHIEDLSFPLALASRGLDGTDKLPNFPYRDDGLMIWCAIADFVQEYINCYYVDDLEVRKDNELQQWYCHAFQFGLPAMDSNEEDFHILEKSELCGFITCLIWICTGYQSCLINNLYEQMAFIPDRPIFLRLPPPLEEKPSQEFSEEDFLEYLPQKGSSFSSVAIMHTLSQFRKSDNEGMYLTDYITDTKAVAAINSFQSNLKNIEKIIKQRNEKRDEKCTLMLPSQIKIGVSLK